MAAEANLPTGEKQAGRDAKGRLVKGVSGNPTGRPKGLKGVEDLARAHTAEAIRTLAEVMRNRRAPAVARVNASNSLLDRGWGKPKQMQEIEVRTDMAGLLEEMRSVREPNV